MAKRAGQTPYSDEWNWSMEWRRKEKEERGDYDDPLTKKKRSKLPLGARLEHHSDKFNRENEGRINTRTEDDYNRWVGMVQTDNMQREVNWNKALKKIREDNTKKAASSVQRLKKSWKYTDK